MMQLRDYQEQAVSNVLTDWQQHTSVLGVAATGAGKTQIFLSVLKRIMGPDDRAIIIAHREELIAQPLARLNDVWPESLLDAGIVMANQDQCDKRIIIATIQTLNAKGRLDRILAYGPITYVVVDEAHHSAAVSYRNVLDVLVGQGAKCLGVTATPIRGDGVGLKSVFEKVSFRYGIKEMVEKGWLVPPRWLAIQTGISLAGVTTRAGDYAPGELASVYETQNCFDLVVASHQKYADGRQAIAFVESVEGAYRLAETFNAAGIPALAADGTTAKDDRRNVLKSFQSGETKVLCNVGLYTEGLDVPQTACIHQVRPTQSDGLYIQMIGRGLRPSPGKEDCLILDFVPQETRNVVLLGDILGVPVDKREMEKPQKDDEPAAGFTFDGKVHYLKGNAQELIERQLDYLNLSPWAWYNGPDKWQSLTLGFHKDGSEHVLAIAPEHDRLFHAWRGSDKKWRCEIAFEGLYDGLLTKVDDLTDKYADASLSARDRAWRSVAASPAQVEFAQNLGVWQIGMTKGQCAQAITHELVLRCVLPYHRAHPQGQQEFAW